MATKYCKFCDTTKPIVDFYLEKVNKDGSPRHKSICKSCCSSRYASKVDGKSNYAKYSKGKRTINGSLVWLSSIRARAKKFNLPFDITAEDLVVPPTCPILDIPLIAGGKLSPNTPSLDRVDSTLGYIKGNVRVISHRANQLKSDASIAELERLIAYMKGV